MVPVALVSENFAREFWRTPEEALDGVFEFR